MGKKNEESVAMDENVSLTIPEGMDMSVIQEGFEDTDLDGVQLRLGQIGIAHQIQMFKMPGGDAVKAFDGIILDITAVNAWWEQSFDNSGGGTPPDCFSMDGVNMNPMANIPQSETGRCADCQNNKFGSDGHRGKACKNMKRIHILLPDGSQFPKRLTVPPTSIRALDGYISILADHSIPFWKVVTSFSLKEASNKEGIRYSALELRAGSFAADSREGFNEIKEMINRHRAVMKEQRVTPDEFDPSFEDAVEDEAPF